MEIGADTAWGTTDPTDGSDLDVTPTPTSARREFALLLTREDRKQREQGILDSIDGPICVVDRNGVIQAVNKAWTRFAAEHVGHESVEGLLDSEYGLGRDYHEVCREVSGDDVELAAETSAGLRAVLDGSRDRFTMEFPSHLPNVQRWFLLTISPLDSEGGGAVVAHVDSTEQVQLRLANEALDAFAQSLVLAFRTPLGQMRANLDSLTPLPEGFPQYLYPEFQHLSEGVDLLDSMVRDLLAYGRLGRSSILLRPTDLGHAISEALYVQAGRISRTHARVSVADPFPHIMADPVLLTESISRLLSNALKFTEEGCEPEITIHAENRPESVWLWLEDRGIGIDPRDYSAIFAIFGRGDRAIRYPGNGIGLAIVRQCMKQMGGSVEVMARDGGGTRFKLGFPKRVGSKLDR